MERNITITLEKAREWYNSDYSSLKEIALQAFSKEELTGFDLKKIKTFKDALTVLGHYQEVIIKLWNYKFSHYKLNKKDYINLKL